MIGQATPGKQYNPNTGQMEEGHFDAPGSWAWGPGTKPPQLPGTNPPFTTNPPTGTVTPINTLPGNPSSGGTNPYGPGGTTNPPFTTNQPGGNTPINTLPANPNANTQGGTWGQPGLSPPTIFPTGGPGLPGSPGSQAGGGGLPAQAGSGMIPGSAALPGMFQDPSNWSSAPGTNFHVQTGISAGPIWSPEQTQAGADAIRYAPQALAGNVQAQARGLPAGAQSAAMQQLSDATSEGNSRGSLNFLRNASEMNAKENLDSQKARAFAGGMPWMNLLTSQRQAEGAEQMKSNSQLVQMLMGMM